MQDWVFRCARKMIKCCGISINDLDKVFHQDNHDNEMTKKNFDLLKGLVMGLRKKVAFRRLH